MPNIVPVLTIEILGDLKKQKKGEKTEQAIVQGIAQKLLPFDNAFNTAHKELILGSILGHPIQADGRPILRNGKNVKTPEGKRGIIFEQTTEEIVLKRWQEGRFSDAEELLAEKWREFSKSQDLKILKDNLEKWFGKIPKFTNLEEILKYLDYIFELKTNQESILALLIYQFGLANSGSSIFLNWFQKGSPLLRIFSPYAMYCLKVSLLCEIGMLSHLLGTKTTNSIDMQYLYYLPFCMVFCSGDKFHIELTSLFLEEKQYFVQATELKKDLALISEMSKNPDGTNNNLDFTLLEGKKSITYEIWKKRMRFLPGTEESRHPSKKSENEEKVKDSSEDLMRRIKEESEAMETDEQFGVDEADFIIRKNTMRTSDLCLCGSGKLFGDCCYKKVSGDSK